ncbi:FxsA family protein [Rhodomicrobium lacus]|uniref:FxsA family protein n=1 Tax=Rhodomicrobium lacus TaxID=2498452 RepID=UPI000F8D19A4|nr:FxsA family protein [Rhodomicrobium lacus]
MPFVILFLMISWPVLEVASIIQVSRWIGGIPTFLLLAAGVAVGAFLVKSQSRLVGVRVMEAMRSGGSPEKTLLDSGTTSLAGILFMIPGFVSDAVAILLLLPAVRGLLWRGASYGVRARGARWQTRPQPGARPEPQANAQGPVRSETVIDVEFTEVPRGEGKSGSSAKRTDSPWNKG